MIKIIEQGNLKNKEPEITYRAKCEICGCEFECQNEDFYKIEKSLDGNAFVKCPCCGNFVAIKRFSK